MTYLIGFNFKSVCTSSFARMLTWTGPEVASFEGTVDLQVVGSTEASKMLSCVKS